MASWLIIGYSVDFSSISGLWVDLWLLGRFFIQFWLFFDFWLLGRFLVGYWLLGRVLAIGLIFDRNFAFEWIFRFWVDFL